MDKAQLDQRLQKLRDEYVTATVSRRASILIQARCLHTALSILEKKTKYPAPTMRAF